MVHFQPPRSERNKQQTASLANRTGILSLPIELLSNISKDFSRADLCKFRLACTTFTPVASHHLSRRLTRLYIHHRSVQIAINICRHPVFSKTITEVILLERSWPKSSTKHDNWPLRMPISNRVPQNEDDTGATNSECFEQSYSCLFEALATLPNLSRVSLLPPRRDLPTGWNNTARYLDSEHYRNQTTGIGIETTCVFFALLGHAALNIKSCMLLDRGVQPGRSQLLAQCAASVSGVSKLESVAILISLYHTCYERHVAAEDSKQLTEFSLHTFPNFLNLRKLDFVFDRTNTPPWYGSSWPYSAELEVFRHTLPHLEELSFRLSKHQQSSGNRGGLYPMESRDFRVPLKFFRKNFKALNKLVIENILFVDECWLVSDPPGTFFNASSALIALIKEFNTLETFSYTVAKVPHTRVHRVLMNGKDSRCDGCSFYAAIPWPNPLKEFDCLATRFGVELEADGQGGERWDFAKATNLMSIPWDTVLDKDWHSLTSNEVATIDPAFLNIFFGPPNVRDSIR